MAAGREKPAGKKVPPGHVWCEICLSTHERGAYSNGWYIAADEKIRRITGHQEIQDAILDPEHEAAHVFWTPAGAQAELDSRQP